MTHRLIGLEQDYQIPMINVHEHFEKFSGAQRVSMFVDEMHMNANGLRETADVVRQALVQRF